MVTGILEKTPYLQGLEDLLIKNGIDEVYSFRAFDGVKQDGVVLDAITSKNSLDDISDYMDTVDYSNPYYPEQISSALSTVVKSNKLGDLIYYKGVFFKTTGSMATRNHKKEILKSANQR